VFLSVFCAFCAKAAPRVADELQDGGRVITPERHLLNSSSNLYRSFKSTTFEFNSEANRSAIKKAPTTPKSTFFIFFRSNIKSSESH
jgi:protein-L-isoaspartate O-methyltransferase